MLLLKFTYIVLIVGDFHFMWECLCLCLETFWGDTDTKGSLCHLKDALGLSMVDKRGKKFQQADEFFLHVSTAHSTSQIPCFSDILLGFPGASNSGYLQSPWNDNKRRQLRNQRK